MPTMNYKFCSGSCKTEFWRGIGDAKITGEGTSAEHFYAQSMNRDGCCAHCGQPNRLGVPNTSCVS